MDIVVWLRSLGLEQYEAAFRENAIDVSVLPDLTDQDLEKLGVLLGHRRKLLRAIANLETTAKAVAVPFGAPVAVDASRRDTAERRQVTVMFSDLVGSTALSARMDPEDLREVISGYQKCVAETVQRFGGFVAKYMATACSCVLAPGAYAASNQINSIRQLIAARFGTWEVDHQYRFTLFDGLDKPVGHAAGAGVRDQ